MNHRPFHAVFILLPSVLFGWLAWQELVPTGTFRVSWQPGERSAFIDPIRPDQRVVDLKGTANVPQVAVTGDPVYTFVHPHRSFDYADVDVWFRNEGVPIVEAGALVSADGENESYDLQPLENLLIDRSAWKRLDQDGMVLLQRQPTYASVADFLAKPPAGKRIAAYRFDGVLPDGAARLLPSLDLDANRIDFVIARYRTPRREGDWKVGTVRIDPTHALVLRGAWKVALSVPGAADHPTKAAFFVHRLDVAFFRKDLLATLRDKLPWL